MNYTVFSESLDYEDILLHNFNSYSREFGERKFKNVVDKVTTSNKIKKLNTYLKFHNLVPSSTEIIACLNEIPYFIFSRGQTQALAGLIVLQMWNDEVNRHTNQFSNGELKAVAIMILEECKASSF